MGDNYVQWLKAAQQSKPNLSEDLKELEQAYTGRLWHQLSTDLQRVIEKPSFRESPDFILDLYQNLISGVLYRLSPWSVAKIAVNVSKAYDDAQAASESSICTLKPQTPR